MRDWKHSQSDRPLCGARVLVCRRSVCLEGNSVSWWGTFRNEWLERYLSSLGNSWLPAENRAQRSHWSGNKYTIPSLNWLDRSRRTQYCDLFRRRQGETMESQSWVWVLKVARPWAPRQYCKLCGVPSNGPPLGECIKWPDVATMGYRKKERIIGLRGSLWLNLLYGLLGRR